MTFFQADDEMLTKPNGRKRSATEMTPSMPTSAAKRQQTYGRSASRAGNGRSGTDAMFSVAGAIETLADKFGESDAPSTPQRRRAAIHQLEQDDDLSENEQVQAIRLFSRQTAIAETYLAINKKSTRTLYIQSELLDL